MPRLETAVLKLFPSVASTQNPHAIYEIRSAIDDAYGNEVNVCRSDFSPTTVVAARLAVGLKSDLHLFCSLYGVRERGERICVIELEGC